MRLKSFHVRVFRNIIDSGPITVAENTCLVGKNEAGKSALISALNHLNPAKPLTMAYLDSGYRLLRDGVETLEQGTVDRAAVYPRRVVESALRREAAALLLAPNHPNGNVQPSEHDKLLTRAVVLAAETVQVKILDHLIISADDVFSFRKAGLL